MFEGDAGEMRLFVIDQKDIILETVKLAEDKSGDIIIRLYQGTGSTTLCNISTCLPVGRAWETNMLEENKKEIEHDNNNIKLVFRPFEIKTIRLRIKS